MRLDSRRSHAITRPLPATPIARRSTASARAMDAQIAQLVEHATENRSVAGSIPALGTIFLFISMFSCGFVIVIFCRTPHPHSTCRRLRHPSGPCRKDSHRCQRLRGIHSKNRRSLNRNLHDESLFASAAGKRTRMDLVEKKKKRPGFGIPKALSLIWKLNTV